METPPWQWRHKACRSSGIPQQVKQAATCADVCAEGRQVLLVRVLGAVGRVCDAAVGVVALVASHPAAPHAVIRPLPLARRRLLSCRDAGAIAAVGRRVLVEVVRGAASVHCGSLSRWQR